ncbi:MAG TPA: outer membrane protein assembly factor BamA [Thermoanaerobaculia bacterium]|nr:outer membrane protein assembly factor BamA [Thermoanaerobaculia bacterium]
MPSPTPGVATPSAPAAPAAPSAPKETIVGIRVIGYQTVSPETIGHYLGVKVGDPYDPDKIRENFQSLWDVGLLENLSVEAERSPAGVTLIITIEERPTLKEVEFTGNKKFSTTQIKDRLKEAKLEIHSGAPMSLREIAKVRSGIADYYVENGYRSATVDFRIEDVSKTEKKLIFVIDEGDKIKIDDIKFEGNHIFGQQKLRNAMQKTKIATWFRILSDTSTVYNQANYDADVENIKALYHSVGYKDVVVKDPVLDVFIKNPKKPAAKQKKRVKITIPLVEGDQFFTGKIQIVKVDQTGQPDSAEAPLVVPREVILSEFRELKTGSVLNRDLLIEGLSRVESRYKSKGYIYWFADPQYREVGNHVVDVDVKLFEGDKFFLGRLEVTGNTTTRDKVIRREFALDEGDVMNMEAVKKSLQKLQQLGYFKVNEEPEFAVRPQDKKVDLTLKGQETSRNEIQFGAGYSALDGFFGQFSFQTRNFLGRGEILGASAQLGKVSNYYDISYTIPWFMDKNQSVGASLYSRSVDYLNIDEKRKGGSLFFGRGITLFDSWSVLYQYEDVKANFPVRGAQTPPGQPIPPDKFTETTGKTSSFTPGYRWDSRNDPFDPNQGFRYYTTVQLAGTALGGTDNFVKPLLGTSKYFPLRWPKRTYIAVNLEGGWVTSYGGAGIPIFERFQIGGEQSLRGFRAGAVLPLTEKNQVFTDEFGRILGGNKFFVMNLEYVFFSLGPAKLLVFSDVGNVYHETQKFDLSRIRSSVGVEMRVFLPIFQAPLRFIYSWNLHPITPIDQFGFPINSLSERKSGFDFSIGRTF